MLEKGELLWPGTRLTRGVCPPRDGIVVVVWVLIRLVPLIIEERILRDAIMRVQGRFLSRSRRAKVDRRSVVPAFVGRHLERLVRCSPFVVAWTLLVACYRRSAFSTRRLPLELAPAEEAETEEDEEDKDTRPDEDADKPAVRASDGRVRRLGRFVPVGRLSAAAKREGREQGSVGSGARPAGSGAA